MTFYKFLIIIIFLIYLYNRLNQGPYISQSGKYWKVIIQKNNFDKSSLNINKGDIVEFINHDQIRHTIKTNNMNIQNSPILFQNDIWQYKHEINNDVIFESSLYSNMNKIILRNKDKDNNKNTSIIELKTNIKEIKEKINEKKTNLINKLMNVLK